MRQPFADDRQPGRRPHARLHAARRHGGRHAPAARGDVTLPRRRPARQPATDVARQRATYSTASVLCFLMRLPPCATDVNFVLHFLRTLPIMKIDFINDNGKEWSTKQCNPGCETVCRLHCRQHTTQKLPHSHSRLPLQYPLNAETTTPWGLQPQAFRVSADRTSNEASRSKRPATSAIPACHGMQRAA